MRIKSLIGLIALAFASRAFAIKPASPDEIKAIKDQIVVANKMDTVVKEARTELANTRFPQGTPEYLLLERAHRRIKDKQYAAYTKAIHMTILAYDLEPRSRRGTSVMPWTKGREIVWLPVAGEDPTRDLEDARGNLKETSRTPLDWAGRTFTDGVTYINPETLRMGPDFLASTLLHERTHFEQHTTRGRGDTLSTAETEVEAYQVELDNLDYFFDKSNPNRTWARNHIEALQAGKQRKVDEQRAAKKGLPGLINRIFPPTPDPDFNDSTLHTDAELETLKKQSDQFDAEARVEATKLADQARAQALIARRDHDERLKNTYIDLARRFCAAHGGVSQAELDALPKPYGREIVYDDPPGLQGCEATIYSAISRGVKADALIFQIPVPVQGVRPSPPVAIIPRIYFSSNLTDLSELSKRACSSAGRIEGAERLVNPLNPYFFRREIDDEKIEELSARLDDCSRRLFNELVEMIRAGQGAAVTSRWLRNRANDYSSRPIYAAPSGGAPRRSGRCEDYGNVRCP